MRGVEIHREPVNTGAVLHLSLNMPWERGLLPVMTRGADFDVRAVFRDAQLKFRQVVNLPGHRGLDGHVVPDVAAGAVSSEGQGDGFIWMCGHLERLTCMTTLAARRPTGLLALTFGGPGLVLTGRLTGGGTVSGQLSFDGAKFSQHLSELGFESFAVWAGVVSYT